MEQQKVDGFIPFGPEWEQEIMKFTKKGIIDMLRKAQIRRKEAEGEVKWYKAKYENMEKILKQHGVSL